MILLNCQTIEYCKELNKSVMKQSACSAVICQPSGHEQKHNNNIMILNTQILSVKQLQTAIGLMLKNMYFSHISHIL